MNKTNKIKVKQLLLGTVLLLVSFVSLASVMDMKRLVVEQNFQGAYELGNELLADEAGNPSFDMLYGIAASRIAKYDQALFAFERVLMFDSTAPVPRYELARLHYLLGNFITARYHFTLVQESQPKPPLVILNRVQWYLATMQAKEAGKAVATQNEAVNRFYLGASLGYDNNPRNMTHLDVFFFGRLLDDLPKAQSDTFHELRFGANRLQQLTPRWGWFISGDASFRGYHQDQKSMDNYSFGLQGGGILLGKDWRLSMPLQANKQVRDDGNEVLVLALATNFNQRLSSQWDYSIFGQVADIAFKPGKGSRDLNSFTSGIIYSYRFNENLRLYAGPIFGKEKPKVQKNRYLGRNLYGLRTGLGYGFNDKQRLDLHFNYLKAKHQADDPSFINERRIDDQINYGVKFSQNYSKNLLLDIGVQQSNSSSTLNLYSYRRTQVSAGIRKEW